MSDPILASIVTGGGRGIGRSIGSRLGSMGAVLLVGRTESDLRSAAEQIRQSGNPQVEVCVGDVADPTTAARAVALLRERGWTIRNLICNAGIGKGGPTESFDPELWRQTIDVNLGSSFHFVQACLPAMLESGRGIICLLSSISGLKGAAYNAAYSASKHALVGLARTLALEYGKRGIVAVPICPGFVESDMTRRTVRGLMKRRGIPPEEAEKLVARVNPQRRIIPPEEVAEMVAFVCSGKVPSLSGNPLILTGGE